MSSLDAELRVFVGGYYFNNSAKGFEEIPGPRVRAELHLYDLSLLDEGSRLTLEGFIQLFQPVGSDVLSWLLNHVNLRRFSSSSMIDFFTSSADLLSLSGLSPT